MIKGIFETMYARQGHVFNRISHLKRLNKALIKLGGQELSERDFDQLLPNVNGVIKLIYTSQEGFKIETRKYPYKIEDYHKGYSLKFLDRILQSTNEELLYKSTQNEYRHKDLSKIRQEGFNEGIYINEKNQVTECVFCNLFFIKDQALYTPHVSCGLLEGTMRGYVMNRAKELGIRVNLGYYSKEEVVNAEEVFITNALIGIMPIHTIDEKAFTIGSITRELLNGLF